MNAARRHAMLLALGLALVTGAAALWMDPRVARAVMTASIGPWCTSSFARTQ